jgi:F-type H+-transporting ATPase subunit gamma
MANLKDIRAKINSTQKTQQTTKAMKMVSAAKLRRAQNSIVNARPYAYRLDSIIHKIAETNRVEHPLMSTPQEGGSLLLVVMTSDRGLCGAFNTNVIRYAKNFMQENKHKYDSIDFIFIGRKGAEFFKKLGVTPIKTITNLANEIKYTVAAEISEDLWKAFLAGSYSQVRLVYNEFKSAISQKVTDEVLLPIQRYEENAVERNNTVEKTAIEASKDFIFEPEPQKIIEELLTKHFAIQVYRCMQESLASEHGARMASMENATKNAGEMIRMMTLTYNKIRQAAITTELIEITSGAEALKG